MFKKWLFIFSSFVFLNSFAFAVDGIGQTIQITTQLDEYVGKPSWLLVIRDLDHNENIPYVFEFNRAQNYWLALTRGRHYLILASTLRIVTYHPRTNLFRLYKIHNFCNLESNGRIINGDSYTVVLQGELTPNRDTATCNISRYPDPSFTLVPQQDLS